MATRQPRYSKEEFARHGNEIYNTQVRSQVEDGNHGRIVAIDLKTPQFIRRTNELILLAVVVLGAIAYVKV